MQSTGVQHLPSNKNIFPACRTIVAADSLQAIVMKNSIAILHTERYTVCIMCYKCS